MSKGLHQRALALATRAANGRSGAYKQLGLFQMPRMLAGNQRFSAEGFPETVRSRALDRAGAREYFGRVVRTHGFSSERVGGPMRCLVCGLPELLRGRIREWYKVRRNPFSRRRIGPDRTFAVRH